MNLIVRMNGSYHSRIFGFDSWRSCVLDCLFFVKKINQLRITFCSNKVCSKKHNLNYSNKSSSPFTFSSRWFKKKQHSDFQLVRGREMLFKSRFIGKERQWRACCCPISSVAFLPVFCIMCSPCTLPVMHSILFPFLHSHKK